MLVAIFVAISLADIAELASGTLSELDDLRRSSSFDDFGSRMSSYEHYYDDDQRFDDDLQTHPHVMYDDDWWHAEYALLNDENYVINDSSDDGSTASGTSIPLVPIGSGSSFGFDASTSSLLMMASTEGQRRGCARKPAGGSGTHAATDVDG